MVALDTISKRSLYIGNMMCGVLENTRI